LGGGKYSSNFLFHLVTTSIKIFLYLSYMKLGCQTNYKRVLLNISRVVKCFWLQCHPLRKILMFLPVPLLLYIRKFVWLQNIWYMTLHTVH